MSPRIEVSKFLLWETELFQESAAADRDATPPLPSPARGASRPLSSGVQAGGPLRFLRLPPRLKAWGAPAASRGRVLALRAAGRTNPLTRHPLAEAGSAPQFWPVLRFSAGCGVKGTPGGRMRSAAEGEHRTGEDVGEAVPLMPLEAIQPFGKGEVKGNARRACPRSQSGKNRRGMQPEGGCPSGARSGNW
jgi:hypothetical protein